MYKVESGSVANLWRKAVDERIAQLFGRFELDDAMFTDVLFDADTRTGAEVKEAIERHRWTPPPNTPSATQLLREDRD